MRLTAGGSYRKMFSKGKVLRGVKIALSTLWWTVLLLLCALMIFIMGTKMRGGVPKVFGYSVMRIVSGSMEPDIPRDSYILIKEISPEDVKRGDVICFYSDDPVIYGFPNTHRVVEEPYEENGEIMFVTAGDNSPAKDSVVARGDRLIGIYVKNLDFLGFFDTLFSGKGVMIIIFAAEGLFFGAMIFSCVKRRKDSSKKTPERTEDKGEDTP